MKTITGYIVTWKMFQKMHFEFVGTKKAAEKLKKELSGHDSSISNKITFKIK